MHFPELTTYNLQDPCSLAKLRHLAQLVQCRATAGLSSQWFTVSLQDLSAF